jgi:hypothetical protein
VLLICTGTVPGRQVKKNDMLVASGLEHPIPLDPLLAQFPDLLLSLSPAKWQVFSEKKKLLFYPNFFLYIYFTF